MTDILPRAIYLAELSPLVGMMLTAECEPRAVPLQLVEATALINHARLDRPPFILIFRSAPDALLMTGGYVMRGAGFGPDTIHVAQIVAPSDGAAGHYYQALFN